jgi:hypothetical protein
MDYYSKIPSETLIPYTYQRRNLSLRELQFISNHHPNYLSSEFLEHAGSRRKNQAGNFSPNPSAGHAHYAFFSHSGVTLVLIHEWVVEFLEARHDDWKVFLCRKDGRPQMEYPAPIHYKPSVFRYANAHSWEVTFSDFLLLLLTNDIVNRGTKIQKLLKIIDWVYGKSITWFLLSGFVLDFMFGLNFSHNDLPLWFPYSLWAICLMFGWELLDIWNYIRHRQYTI